MVVQMGFTLDGLMTAPTKSNIKTALANALTIDASLIVDVLIDGSRRSLGGSTSTPEQRRRLLSSSVVATISLPTASAAAAVTNASPTTMLANIVSSYNSASGQSAVSVGGLTVVNVTPTAAPVAPPSSSPAADSNLAVALGAGIGAGVFGLGVIGAAAWHYHYSRSPPSEPKESFAFDQEADATCKDTIDEAPSDSAANEQAVVLTDNTRVAEQPVTATA
jgi:hypothetical protein